MRRKLFTLLLALGVLGVLAAPSPVMAQEAHTVEEVSIPSVPDASGPVTIVVSVFKPAGASATNKVPVIFHSHGWGGARATAVSGEVQAFLDAGFGVVSIDQRGHGESTGEANVEDPNYEGQDIKRIIDYTAALDWVQKDLDANGNEIAGDPVLGAIGGSYGGGYQTMGALTEVLETSTLGADGKATEVGDTRFNALAPEITWFDLPESLAPQSVPRTAWTSALYAVGAQNLPMYVHQAFAFGAATGMWPDGTVAQVPNLEQEFGEHSPRWFVDRGMQLDIPVIVRQGSSDNLFNLNQGIHNFEQTLTPAARAQSIFVAFNGGHNLPSAMPLGYPVGAPLSAEDACSGNWTQKRIDFFRAAFSGGDTRAVYPNHYNLTTADGECIGSDTLGAPKTFQIDPAALGGWGTPTGPAGAPVHYKLIDGPVTVAGIPTLTGELWNTLDARAFFGLSIGTVAGPGPIGADPQLIQNNMMPVRELMPHDPEVVGAADVDVELPGVVVEVPAGKSLFLTISPFSDMSFGHGSRAPGLMVISDLQVHVPLL